MSERQAKRLRRARRAFIVGNKKSLAAGSPVARAAYTAHDFVARVWPTLNHRERGDVAARLARGYNAITNVALRLAGAA